jgi:NADH-quinone oxidoreductase subunit A
MSPLAAYLLLFLAVGAGFVLVNLMLGKLVRPHRPDAEKGTVYECGEPTIGSAWVQFDLRYYVIALLFVIFDVEVAFFFPWAEVFGKANAINEVGPPTSADAIHQIADRALPMTPVPANRLPTDPQKATYSALPAVRAWSRLKSVTQEELDAYNAKIHQPGRKSPQELDEINKMRERLQAAEYVSNEANRIRWLAFVEILIFFGVLLVGFAYLWRRGDLAWVRSLPERQATAREEAAPLAATPARVVRVEETPETVTS